MNLSNKKILDLHCSNELYNQIKNGEIKSVFREYNKLWIQKVSYPCGTIKNFDLVSIHNENQTDEPQLLFYLKEIKIVKEKKGWFGAKKSFEIELLYSYLDN